MESASPGGAGPGASGRGSIDEEMLQDAATSTDEVTQPAMQCATCGAMGPGLDGFWKMCMICGAPVCIACFTPFAPHEEVRCMNCMITVYRREVAEFEETQRQDAHESEAESRGEASGNEVHLQEESPPNWGDEDGSAAETASDGFKTPVRPPLLDEFAEQADLMSLPGGEMVYESDAEPEKVAEDDVGLGAYVELLANAERRANAPVMKPMWEMGFMANIFGNVIGFLDKRPERPRAVPVPLLALEIESKQEIAHSVSLEVHGPRFRKRKPWIDDLAEKRQVAIAAWKYVLTRRDVVSKTGGFMKALEENEAMHVLMDTLENKATSTIKQRAESMVNYQRWAESSGRTPYPPSEDTVYLYVSEMRQNKAPATRASRFKECLNFAKHTFGMVVDEGILESKRVAGAILASAKTKRMLVQRAPLTVDMVSKLEALVMQEELAVTTRVFVGYVLLMIHTRARFSDAMHIETEPLIEGEWLEAETAQYKQANQPHRRNKFLYLVGMAKGVSGVPWAETWLRIRRSAGLVANKKLPFMPTHTPGGRYTRSALTLWEFTLWFRDVLRSVGVPAEVLADLGSHSCKTTTLSWMAKGGLAKDDRKWLGGHLEKNEISLAAYSRDMLAGPLRRMKKLFMAITTGEFKPDASRSGRWQSEEVAERVVDKIVEQRAKDNLGTEEQVLVHSSTSSDSSSSTGSSTEASSSNSGEPEVQIEAAESAVKKYKPAGEDGQPMWKHVRYGTYHLQKAGEQELACSRPLTNYVQVERVAFVFPKCKICFGSEVARPTADAGD
jgi:hypothetical protein